MGKRKNKVKTAMLLIAAVSIPAVILIGRPGSDSGVRARILSGTYELADGEELPGYEEYISSRKDYFAAGGTEIVLRGNEYTEHDLSSLEELEDGSVATGSSGSITYSFPVDRKGAYYIEMDYLPDSSSNLAIIRNILVNHRVLFREAQGIVFEREFTDENKGFLNQTNKNQAIPVQLQRTGVIKKRLEASDKSVAGALLFCLEEGMNTITLTSVKDSLTLKEIRIVPGTGLMSYEEYLEYYRSEGARIIQAKDMKEPVMVQAEDSYSKTSAMLVPVNDRTSAKTIPYHPSNIILNTIGGDAWETVGSGITWEVTVPESGLYKIGVRYQQAMNRDFYSIRELKINGAVPFRESGNLKFYYNSKFQYHYLGDEKGAYYFYLDEGKNRFSMTVSLGDLAYAMGQTSVSVKNFNDLYRRLAAVMGTNPDHYRDYNILASVPDMITVLKTEYFRLNLIMESLGDTLHSNTKTREIAKLMYQMEKIVKKPDAIAKEFIAFNDNITALSEWMLSLGNQPLLLDYFTFCPEGYTLPEAEGGILARTGHMIRSIAGSFTNDYMIDDPITAKKDKELEVWIAAATRDQYDIAARMVSNSFQDSNIRVELKMVGADTVMPATLTGNGPDVAIQLNYTMPTNFAYRDAGYDLTRFSDFDEVKERFSPGAMEYFYYKDGCYALPDQMSFPVMYYRKDILEELGIPVPDTWEELLGIIPALKAKNMSVWFATTGHTILGGYSSTATKPVNNVFLSLLYQNKEELYKEDGLASNLDSMGSLLTFKYWTEFYTKQSFELHISTVTRFRTGEVPIFIDDYTVQNTILAAAPEIEGAWDMAPIPGTKGENGAVDRSTAVMVGAGMILKNIVDERDTAREAWEFLKWWTAKDTQIRYALEQKALLGEAAIFPVANLEAAAELAANEDKEEVIREVTGWLRGMPQVPGGYLTGRSVENAFLSVFYNNVNPVDTLYSQIKDINQELMNKHKEFGVIY